jgi:hypothetical protein
MESFETLASLKEWCADHTGPECAALYNRIEGTKPVSRFENRDIAANRIWKAMSQPVIEATPVLVAAKKDPLPKARKQGAKPTSKKPARAKKPAAAPSKDGRVAAATALVQRERGVKLSELMKRFGWKAHTSRGFMSVLASKHGVKFESIRNDAGERCYRGG